MVEDLFKPYYYVLADEESNDGIESKIDQWNPYMRI